MKSKLSFVAAIILLTACHGGKEQSSETSSEGGPQPGCYAFREGGSSIELQLEMTGDAVSGNLLYSLAEKDKNTGTIKGTVRGNTVDAYYTFSSEGTTSVREVIFQWVDNSLIEGIGEHVERNDTSFYVDRKKVTFTDSKVALKKCE
jgi:hypothetical protein